MSEPRASAESVFGWQIRLELANVVRTGKPTNVWCSGPHGGRRRPAIGAAGEPRPFFRSSASKALTDLCQSPNGFGTQASVSIEGEPRAIRHQAWPAPLAPARTAQRSAASRRRAGAARLSTRFLFIFPFMCMLYHVYNMTCPYGIPQTGAACGEGLHVASQRRQRGRPAMRRLRPPLRRHIVAPLSRC